MFKATIGNIILITTHLTHWLLFVPLVYRLATTLVVAGVLIKLSIAPGIQVAGDSVFNWLVVNTSTPVQKAAHIGAYAILAFLSMWTLDFIESRSLRALIALTVTIGLGAGLEWHQLQVPGRFGTIADVLLNSLGALFGLVFAMFLLRPAAMELPISP